MRLDLYLRTRRATAVAALLIAAVGPAAACQLLAGLERVDIVATDGDAAAPGGDGSLADATADGGAGGGSAADAAPPPYDPCGPSTAWPAAPPPGAFQGDGWVRTAVQHAYFGAAPLPAAEVGVLCPSPGYNLDDLDTCNAAVDLGDGGPEGIACAARGQNGQNCDGQLGRDVAITALLSDNASALGSEAAWLENGLKAGVAGLMIEISGYNGQPDDPEVIIDALILSGPEDTDGGPPTWLPLEPWVIDATSCVGTTTCQVPIYTAKGYVRGGHVFARFVDVLIPFAVKGQQILVHGRDVRMTGLLVQHDGAGRFGIELGRVAGRIDLVDLLTGVGSLPVGDAGPLCKNPVFFDILRTAACDYADLPSGAPDAGAPCTSLSYGISFSAVPAVRGSLVVVPAVPSLCLDAGFECN